MGFFEKYPMDDRSFRDAHIRKDDEIMVSRSVIGCYLYSAEHGDGSGSEIEDILIQLSLFTALQCESRLDE